MRQLTAMAIIGLALLGFLFLAIFRRARDTRRFKGLGILVAAFALYLLVGSQIIGLQHVAKTS